MKIEHLKLIQNVIDRMANNSFLLKGWAIIIITAIFTFISTEKIDNYNMQIILFTNVPLITFWGLDSYYLQQERKYRVLYDFVRIKKGKHSDFNMNPNKIKLTIEDSKKICYFNCLLSVTEIMFYGICMAMTIIIYILG